MSAPTPAPAYCRLTQSSFLKLLEKPFLFNRATDDLYETDPTGFAALRLCDGTRTVAETGLEEEFLKTCLDEGLLELLPSPSSVAVEPKGPSPVPSLRYLELQLTWRCNLACRHCYLGEARTVDLPLEAISRAIDEFEELGGLRLIISGGEPTLHPAWEEVNGLLASRALRRVLLTNGTTLNRLDLEKLNFDAVQISLDGLEPGHDALRGKGSFSRALEGAKLVAASGLDLAFATQVHRENLEEFDELDGLVRGLGAREWGIDAPCATGRLLGGSPLLLNPVDSARAMAHAFGASYHGSGEGMACGLHLATVGANGKVAQCGFYFDSPLGTAEEGLLACWKRRKPLALAEIPACSSCGAAPDCGGGCRIRAGGALLPDLVMCAAMGAAFPPQTGDFNPDVKEHGDG